MQPCCTGLAFKTSAFGLESRGEKACIKIKLAKTLYFFPLIHSWKQWNCSVWDFLETVVGERPIVAAVSPYNYLAKMQATENGT